MISVLMILYLNGLMCGRSYTLYPYVDDLMWMILYPVSLCG
jgi:hypothetical protein